MSHFMVGVILPNNIEYTNDMNNLYDIVYNIILPYKEDCGFNDVPSEYLKFYEDEFGDEIDEETGKRGYWQNPNAKWDWFSIGGRWDESIPLKNMRKNHANIANIKDIDFDIDENIYKEAEEFFDWKINDAKYQEDDGCIGTCPAVSFYVPYFCSKQYLLDRYGDKDTFAKYNSRFIFRTVVTPDGKWHEVGQMGWFGCSDETAQDLKSWIDVFDERFVDPYLDNYIVVVDCHI